MQESINYAEYEMSLQGEKILECLQNYYRKENEDYTEIAPNQFFLSFYSICLMNRQYGDKKESGQSIFVRNLGYLKEEVNIELLKRRKMNHEFMGLTALTILPVFAIKPIEHWALHYMPEMENRYCGTQGMMATVLLMIFTIAVYKLISVLKRMNHSEKYKNKWVEQWSQSDRINRFICLYLAHRKKSAEKLNRLVRETGYAYNLAELILHHPDIIFLSGSTNTMGDLKWMRQNGLEAAVKKFAVDIPVFGICGGYQMLGDEISDPDEVEEGRSMRGMELLPVVTVLQKQKQRGQTEGKIAQVSGILKGISGCGFDGYEIHMGKTGWSEKKEKQPENVISAGNVYGSYIHGLFDHAETADVILHALAEKKGVSLQGGEMEDYRTFKEKQYDKLADTLRVYLDMEEIYGMLREASLE